MKIKNIYGRLKKQKAIQSLIEEGRGERIIAVGEMKGKLLGINLDGESNGNVFLTGGAGTGKTYNHIIGNLMLMKTSAVVIDPYGWVEKEYKDYFLDRGVKVLSLSKENIDCVSDFVSAVRKDKGIIFVNGQDYNFRDSEEETVTIIESLIGEMFCNFKGEYISFYFDTLPNIPVIDGLANFMFLARSLNAGVTVVVQDVSQLKNLYPHDYQTVVGLCDTVILTGNYSSLYNQIRNFSSDFTVSEKRLLKNLKVSDIQYEDYRNVVSYKNFVSVKGGDFIVCSQLKPKGE